MKFLAFTDIHENREALAKLAKRAASTDVDFSICAGDFSTFGKGLQVVLKRFEEIKKPLYIIPGNHEEHLDLVDLFEKYSFCKILHEKDLVIGEYILLGYGGGGFSQHDPHFRKIARNWYGNHKGKKIILVTHGPPHHTKLDDLDGRHVGNIDYRKFIERMSPTIAISGHLHETVGLIDTIGKTKLINPGWDGMVIELN